VAAEPRRRLHVVEFVMNVGTSDVKHPLLSGLPRPMLKALLVVLEHVFALLRKKAVYPFPYNAKTHTISLPAQIELELRGLVSTGKKVEAMKRVISLTGAGLRVSKDYVDQLAKGHESQRCLAGCDVLSRKTRH
jgi:hypothetical protein